MDANAFTRDPIKLIIWSKIPNLGRDTKEQSNWGHKIVVIGGSRTPKAVRAEVMAKYKLFKSGRAVGESRILTHWYGSGWKGKLMLQKKTVAGGDALDVEVESAPESADFMETDLSERELEEMAPPPPPMPMTTDAAQIDEKTVLDQETKSEFIVESGPEIDVSSFIIDKSDLEHSAIKERRTIDHTDATHEFVWDFTLFPEDKVQDLKYKINKYLGIPMFRQHIWYMHQGHAFPLKYSLMGVQTGAIVVDFWNQILYPSSSEGQQLILGMPVAMYLYRIKDSLKVEAYDNFTLLGKLYAQRGVTEYHVVDLETFVAPVRTELAQLVKTDKYQINMLYYAFVFRFWPMLNPSVWEEYLLNKNLSTSYPQLDPPREELLYIDRQQGLINDLYGLLEDDQKKMHDIEKNVKKSLTTTTLKVSSTYRGKVVNMRILFDLLECTPELDAIRLYDIVDGRHIMIDKYHRDASRSTEKMIPGVMYVRVVINQKPYQKLNLFIYPNATYAISSTWGEDLNFGFADVNKMVDMHITPIVKRMNALAGKVMYFNNMQFPIMDKSNVKYVDIAISMFWKQALNSEEFKLLKTVLDKFASARLIQEKQVDRNVLTYFFKKGMYELDAKRIEKLQIVDNYYAYLFNSDVRQKWYLLFENIRVMAVTHRFSDLKIEISGIKEDEYYIFQRYIILMLHMFLKLKPPQQPQKQVHERVAKPLSNLKEQDPHLYNFKRVYGSPIVYSKICQKPYQPLLMTQAQFDNLKDKKTRENVVKYWNFTTKTPAYYRCPNPKFPYIRFITGKHPMGFCIPCCKITPPPSDPADKQRRIYDSCMKDHKYQKKTAEHSSSRYIMSYGKPIDIGRLSNLPESSLEPLLSDTKPDDEEQVMEAKYYLYGVPQNHPRVEYIGYLYCLSSAMAIEASALIVRIAGLIRKNPGQFHMLLGGEIIKYWPTWQDLVRDLMQLNTHNGLPLMDAPWNRLLIDIARLYLNVQTLEFEDRNTVIQLRVPPHMVSPDDYFYPNFQHLIVLHNLQSDYWNPIYVIHKEVYFRANIIEKRMFDYQSDIVQLIVDMVRTRFAKKVQTSNITLDIMKRFASKLAKANISKLLLMRNNMCYGVHVDGLGYVPVHASYFKFESGGIDVSFSSRDIQPAKLNDLLKFTSQWNLWVAKQSQEAGFTKVDVPASRPILERIEPIYPLVRVEKWLQFPSNRIEGFQAAGMNWYIQPISLKAARDEADVPIISLNYNPLDVNALLEKYPNVENKQDKRMELLNKSLYEHYLFRILLLDFIRLFNKQKNARVRTEIKKLFAKADFRTRMREVHTQIQKIVMMGMDPNHPLLQLDIEKIQGQISDFISLGQTRKHLLKVFESDYYNFDRAILERMKQLPRDQIRSQLSKLADEISTVGEPEDWKEDFPNMLLGCDSGAGFCKRGKLLIPAKKRDEFLNILADQIKNPFVEKYLFSPLFAGNIISYFKFIKHPDEIVEVEFL